MVPESWNLFELFKFNFLLVICKHNVIRLTDKCMSMKRVLSYDSIALLNENRGAKLCIVIHYCFTLNCRGIITLYFLFPSRLGILQRHLVRNWGELRLSDDHPAWPKTTQRGHLCHFTKSTSLYQCVVPHRILEISKQTRGYKKTRTRLRVLRRKSLNPRAAIEGEDPRRNTVSIPIPSTSEAYWDAASEVPYRPWHPQAIIVEGIPKMWEFCGAEGRWALKFIYMKIYTPLLHVWGPPSLPLNSA